MTAPHPDAAQRLLDDRDTIARAVVAVFYERHPEWNERWGAEGRRYCLEDNLFHLQFLAGALRSGSPAMFTSYVSWLADVLRKRGVDAESLAENLDLLRVAVADRLDAEGAAVADELLLHGKGSLEREPPRKPRNRATLDERGERLLDAMLEGDGHATRAILRGALDEGLTLAQLGDDVVQPVMEELGHRWQTNAVSVAQEHLGTALVLSSLAQVALHRPAQPRGERSALFACVEGNRHSLGLRMVADAFAARGWRIFYLGDDVPRRSLVDEVARRQPDVLGLSISLPQHVAPAYEAVKAVRERMGARTPRIALGGLLVIEHPELREVVGADFTFPGAVATEALDDAAGEQP